MARPLEIQNNRSSRRHGYSQKEVTDYLGLHYSTINRLVNEDNKKTSK
jgi:transposase